MRDINSVLFHKSIDPVHSRFHLHDVYGTNPYGTTPTTLSTGNPTTAATTPATTTFGTVTEYIVTITLYLNTTCPIDLPGIEQSFASQLNISVSQLCDVTDSCDTTTSSQSMARALQSYHVYNTDVSVTLHLVAYSMATAEQWLLMAQNLTNVDGITVDSVVGGIQPETFSPTYTIVGPNADGLTFECALWLSTPYEYNITFVQLDTTIILDYVIAHYTVNGAITNYGINSTTAVTQGGYYWNFPASTTDVVTYSFTFGYDNNQQTDSGSFTYSNVPTTTPTTLIPTTVTPTTAVHPTTSANTTAITISSGIHSVPKLFTTALTLLVVSCFL